MGRVELLAGLTSFAAAVVFVRALCSSRLARMVVDVPNARSLHIVPTPRTGGLGVMLAAGLAWVLFAPAALPILFALSCALVGLFLIDDVRGLPVPVRFGAQLAAALVWVWWLWPQPLLLLPLFALGIVWSTNLYNFMDGSNGFAGGMAAFGFGAYALAAGAAGQNDIAIVSCVVAGASAGFLVWNFDPARIFLGDAGSIPLGFLAAALGLLGWHRDAWPFWLPLLIFSPFWIDATCTLVKRALRGEDLSEAHRSHYYQRLVQMGWSHRQLALAEYAVMAAVAATSLGLRRAHPLAVVAILAAWGVFYLGAAFAIDGKWARFRVQK